MSYMLKEIVLGRNKSVNICTGKVKVKGKKKGYKWTKMKYLKKKKQNHLRKIQKTTKSGK